MNQNSIEQNLLVVMTAMNELAKGPSGAYSTASRIATETGLSKQDVTDYMDILAHRELTSPSNSASERCAELTASGRIMLRDADFRPNPPLASITVQGNQGVVMNIGSTLQNVTQTISHSANLPQTEQLSALVEQLQQALEEVPAEYAEEAEAVAETARDLVERSNNEKPNASLVRISAKGLQEAAQTLLTITPAVTTIATKIVSLLSGAPS